MIRCSFAPARNRRQRSYRADLQSPPGRQAAPTPFTEVLFSIFEGSKQQPRQRGPHSSPPVDSFDQLDRTPAPATSKSRTGRSPLRSLRLVADIHATSIRSSSVRSSKPKPVAFATQSAAVLLWLRPGQVKMPFGAKHVTVKVRNPLPPIGRDI